MEIAIVILAAAVVTETYYLRRSMQASKEWQKTCEGLRTVNRLLLKELRQEEWPEEIS